MLKIAGYSTVSVNDGPRKLLYLVGGWKNRNSFERKMNVICVSSDGIDMDVTCFSSLNKYWVLHYLESTGIHYLPGLNLIQEIIQMFE